MKIANAIYDIVFKYLMEDERVAKLLLSALLKMEVESLEFQPQEYISDSKTSTLLIFRIDFKAKIKLPSGESKVVLIELQKAKFPSDILRFRRYLGEQYALEHNIIEVEKDGKKEKEALPIITIYFLGYPLQKYPDTTIIRVKRQYFDDTTDEELVDGKDPFIEALTHDSIIVQIGAIRNKKHRSKIEKVLSIFEPGTNHVIEINEADYPEEYKPVIRRLIMAYTDEQVRKTMKVEDEVLKDLTNAKRKAEEAEQRAEQAEFIAEQERQKAEQERQKAEQAQKRVIESARMMKQAGISVEQIVKITGLTKKDIEEL